MRDCVLFYKGTDREVQTANSVQTSRLEKWTIVRNTILLYILSNAILHKLDERRFYEFDRSKSFKWE